MRINEVPSDTIVVGIDGSPDSTRALDWAAALAQQERRPLTLLHSCDPAAFERGGIRSSWTSDRSELRLQSGQPDGESLTAAQARLRERHPELEVNLVADFVDPRLALHQLASYAHLVVLGSRGRGPVASLLLGSVSSTVARKADCPVVVVKEVAAGDAADGVVVAVGPDTESADGIEFAFRHASTTRRHLHVVRCCERAGAQVPAHVEERWRRIDEEITAMRAKFSDASVSEDVRFDGIGQALIEHSSTADLVVVGRSTPHRLDRVFHIATMTAVLEHAQCPVAVIPERSS